MIKKILCVLLAVSAVGCLGGCFVDHNDGVCDVKDCKRTLGVIRYDEDHELCLEHAIEQGLSD
ncbi:MAG: hypothetical protein IJV85_00685 [Clostridia bacterium]|nr:hypothetical protein [Clostridia bacterium]